MAEKIYQLKISLKGIKPPIWRRVEVKSDSTFLELHDVIQAAMDWFDSHLHSFEIRRKNERIFIEPEVEDEGSFFSISFNEKHDEEEEILSDWLKKEKDKALYTYDFGDDWEHEIVLEKIKTPDPKVTYPICTQAKRVAPVEDSRLEVIMSMEENEGKWQAEVDIPSKELIEEINRAFREGHVKLGFEDPFED